MKNIETVLQHYKEKIMFSLYVLKEETKIKAIRIFRGEEEEKKYVLSRVKIPISYYMHLDMTTLAEILGVDYQGWVLYLDMHDVGIGRMEVPAARAITNDYFGEYGEDLPLAQKRHVTLKYLLKMGDVKQRQINFKLYFVDQWLAGAYPSKEETT